MVIIIIKVVKIINNNDWVSDYLSSKYSLLPLRGKAMVQNQP